MCRQDNHWKSRLGAADVMQQLQTVHAGHSKIGDYGLDSSVFELRSCIDSVRSGFDYVALAAKCFAKGRQHLNIIIYY